MDRKKSGFTLVEIVVAVAVLSILTVMLYTVFKSGADAWSTSETRLDIFQNARIILEQMTQELAGAFVDDDNGAGFTGKETDFAPGYPGDPTEDLSPDTLEFVTVLGDSIYKIEYELDQANNVLQRKYILDPPDYTNDDYDDIVDEPDDIEERITEFGFNISNINFYYWDEVGSVWSVDGTWVEDPPVFILPRAVKIILELQDTEGNVFPFETHVYLPESE
jgi:general secretion pathway protein J